MANEQATETTIDAVKDSVDALSIQVGEVQADLKADISDLNLQVEQLPDLITASSAGDYSNQMQNIQELLAYTDLLLVVLVVFLVLLCGIVLGSFLLKHFRA